MQGQEQGKKAFLYLVAVASKKGVGKQTGSEIRLWRLASLWCSCGAFFPATARREEAQPRVAVVAVAGMPGSRVAEEHE